MVGSGNKAREVKIQTQAGKPGQREARRQPRDRDMSTEGEEAGGRGGGRVGAQHPGTQEPGAACRCYR